MHILTPNDEGYLASATKVLTRDTGESTGFNSLEHRTAAVMPMQIYLTRQRGIDPLQNCLDAL